MAKLAGLLADREALTRQAAVHADSWQSLLQQLEAAEAAWRQCWQVSGIEPRRPREMRAWRQAYQALLQQAEAIRTQQQSLDQLQQRIASHGRQLQQVLGQWGVPAGEAGGTLAELLARGQAMADQLQARAVRRQQLVRSVQQLHQRGEVARQRAQGAEAELQNWRESWAQAMEPLGLNQDTIPAAANAVLGQIGEMFAALRDAADKTERIEGIVRDGETFRTRVVQLVEAIAADLAERPFEQAAEILIGRLEKAVVDQKQRQTLDHTHPAQPPA